MVLSNKGLRGKKAKGEVRAEIFRVVVISALHTRTFSPCLGLAALGWSYSTSDLRGEMSGDPLGVLQVSGHLSRS